jgi:hypothetical protein
MNTMHNGSRSIGLSVPLSFDTYTVSASSRIQLSVSRVGGEFSTSVSNSRNSFSAYLYSRKDESRNEWILQTDVRGRTKSCRKAMLGCPEWVVPCDHCMGGNVSFGPTSRGHPSAPKKRLRPSWLAGTRLFSVLSAERTSIPAPVTNVLRGYPSPPLWLRMAPDSPAGQQMSPPAVRFQQRSRATYIPPPWTEFPSSPRNNANLQM